MVRRGVHFLVRGLKGYQPHFEASSAFEGREHVEGLDLDLYHDPVLKKRVSYCETSLQGRGSEARANITITPLQLRTHLDDVSE